MNKFQKLIADSSSSTLVRRAETISTQAQIAQETVVNSLKNKVSELKLQVDNLTDFAPETTDSLRPGTKGWNPSEWAIALQRSKWDLYVAEQQLKVAEETYKEFFSESSGKQK